MALSEIILAEIGKRFAEPDRETVRSLLAGQDDRMCLAILRLSRGKLSRVEDLLRSAAIDYRDVLAWASQPTRTYIVGLLRKGPHWSPADENGRTHLDTKSLRNWKDLGAIVVGGWFMDLGDPRGLYIFTVDSIEDAQALAQTDDAIRSGKLMFEFHPWLAADGLKIAPPDEL